MKFASNVLPEGRGVELGGEGNGPLACCSTLILMSGVDALPSRVGSVTMICRPEDACCVSDPRLAAIDCFGSSRGALIGLKSMTRQNGVCSGVEGKKSGNA